MRKKLINLTNRTARLVKKTSPMGMQTKMLVKAAEKRFRHRLRRQVEKARVENTILIESSDSDSDVLVVSH